MRTERNTQKELLFRVINAMHVWVERISMLQGYYVWYLDVCNKNRNETIKNIKNSFLSKKYVGHWINWMNFWTRFFLFPCDVLGEYFLILTETYIKEIFSPKIITFRSIHDFNRQLLTRRRYKKYNIWHGPTKYPKHSFRSLYQQILFFCILLRQLLSSTYTLNNEF